MSAATSAFIGFSSLAEIQGRPNRRTDEKGISVDGREYPDGVDFHGWSEGIGIHAFDADPSPPDGDVEYKAKGFVVGPLPFA